MPRKKKPAEKEVVEKRQYLRLGYSRLISFTHYDTNSFVEIPGKMAAVHDLSESGVLIESSVPFEIGNVIDMDMAFEQDRIILAQGEVVHCEKSKKFLYRAGLKFLRIHDKDLVYLKNFLDRQSSQIEISVPEKETRPQKAKAQSQKKAVCKTKKAHLPEPRERNQQQRNPHQRKRRRNSVGFFSVRHCAVSSFFKFRTIHAICFNKTLFSIIFNDF